jgi:hypothetical protein
LGQGQSQPVGGTGHSGCLTTEQLDHHIITLAARWTGQQRLAECAHLVYMNDVDSVARITAPAGVVHGVDTSEKMLRKCSLRGRTTSHYQVDMAAVESLLLPQHGYHIVKVRRRALRSRSFATHPPTPRYHQHVGGRIHTCYVTSLLVRMYSSTISNVCRAHQMTV